MSMDTTEDDPPIPVRRSGRSRGGMTATQQYNKSIEHVVLTCDRFKGRRDAIDKQERNLDRHDRGGAAARGGGGGRSAFVPAGGGKR
eukprot:gene20710-31051_t